MPASVMAAGEPWISGSRADSMSGEHAIERPVAHEGRFLQLLNREEEPLRGKRSAFAEDRQRLPLSPGQAVFGRILFEMPG